MTSIAGIFSLIIILFIVVVVLYYTLPPLINFAISDDARRIVKNIDEAHETMCGIPDKLGVIFDTIDSISPDDLDERSKGIYNQMLWKNDIESCDVIYFYNQLDSEQRKKLNWFELSCNVRQCVDE
jgi:hypothetical protein